MSQATYNQIQRAYRKKYLQFEHKIERNIDRLMLWYSRKMQEKTTSLIGPQGILQAAHQKELLEYNEKLTGAFAKQLIKVLGNAIQGSAAIAMEGQDNAARAHMLEMIEGYQQAGKPKFAELLNKALADPNPLFLSNTFGKGLPAELRNQAFSERWRDGFTLSDRVWHLENNMRGELENTIQNCIEGGMAAPGFSKAVEEYLREPGPAWTTGIKRSVTGTGSVKYNALRLARTETNQAYHRTQAISAKQSDIVKGERWNLSMSHPIDWPPSAGYAGYAEVCEYYAEEDHVGLGPGIFRPGEAPFDHPNGLCFKTDVLLNDKEMKEMLEKKYGAEAEGAIKKPKPGTKEFKKDYQKKLKKRLDKAAKELQAEGWELGDVEWEERMNQEYWNSVKEDIMPQIKEGIDSGELTIGKDLLKTLDQAPPGYVRSQYWRDIAGIDDGTSPFFNTESIGPVSLKNRLDAAEVWLREKVDVGVLTSAGKLEKLTITEWGKKSASWYQHSSKHLQWSNRLNTKVFVHEYGHHLHNHGGVAIKSANTGFFRERTLGKGVGSYYGNESTKIYKMTGFIDEYAGRFYDWEDNIFMSKYWDKGFKNVYGTGREVFSVGVEQMYANPEEFYKHDPEHFTLVWAIMRGLLTD